MTATHSVIRIEHLQTIIDKKIIHTDINLSVIKGEILAIVGGSGSGKTTLLHEMLLLRQPTSGTIHLLGHNIATASSKKISLIQKSCGVLFQQNALFSSLTILENVAFPLQEHFPKLSRHTINQLALLKLDLVGLIRNAAYQYPSELSGGMQKRAALARAIVLDPNVLFLDEPTAGLDPESAAGLDELIIDLQSSLGLTVVMITHDLDSLWSCTNRVAFLGEGQVLAVAPIAELVNHKHLLIQEFFKGPRGRAVQQSYSPL